MQAARRRRRSLHRNVESDAGSGRPACQALQELGMHRKGAADRSPAASGWRRRRQGAGAWADAVAIARGIDRAGRQHPQLEAEYQALGTTAAPMTTGTKGRDPAGINDAGSRTGKAARSNSRRPAIGQFFSRIDAGTQTIARACARVTSITLTGRSRRAHGGSAAIARVPAGRYDWIPGQNRY